MIAIEKFIKDEAGQLKYRIADYNSGHKTIAYYENEEFREFILNSRFLVSDRGNLYDLVKGVKLMPLEGPGGYHYNHIMPKNNPEHPDSRFSVHRAVALTFFPPDTPNYGKYVNHLNECITNNSLHNLKWSTNQENVVYSFLTGTNTGKFGRAHTYFTKDEKLAVCQMISNGIPFSQISKSLGMEYTRTMGKLLSKVKTRIRWKDIWDEFDYNDGRNISYDIPVIDEDYIRKICVMIERRYDIGLMYHTLHGEWTPTEDFKILVRSIKARARYQDISKDYDFPQSTEMTIDKIEAICKLLRDKPYYTHRMIADEIGVPYEHQFAVLVCSIKEGKAWRMISDNYGIVEMYSGEINQNSAKKPIE